MLSRIYTLLLLLTGFPAIYFAFSGLELLPNSRYFSFSASKRVVQPLDILKMDAVLSSAADLIIKDQQKSGLTCEINSPTIPKWFSDLKLTPGSQMVEPHEWMDEAWRGDLQENGGGGFLGFDYCHSIFSSVRILEYVLLPPIACKERNDDIQSLMIDESDQMEGEKQISFFPSSASYSSNPSTSSKEIITDEFPTLIGCVYFTTRSESHRGLCHGGSICA
jgi:hypothetical protein